MKTLVPPSLLRQACLGLAFFLPIAHFEGRDAEPAPPAWTEDGPAIDHLKLSIAWYGRIQGSSQWIVRASDGVYYDNTRALSVEIVKGAFTSATAQAAAIEAESAPLAGASAAAAPGAPAAAGASPASWLKTARDVDQRISELQAQLAGLDRPAAGPAGSPAVGSAENPPAASGGEEAAAAASLAARREALQSELDYEQTIRDAIQQLLNSDRSAKSSGDRNPFIASIDELRNQVPEVFAAAADKKTAPQPGATNGGLIDRVGQLVTLVKGLRGLDDLVATTSLVEAERRRVADPLRAALREIRDQGEAESERTADGRSADPAATGRSFAQLTARFKSLSAALLPLTAEAALLGQCQADFREWHDSLDHQYDAILRTLIVKAAGLVAVVGGLLALSEVWKRATFRYVRDLRRRRQLLLIRRVLTSTFIGIVVILALMSDFGSLATFAGFITAGIAVALQTIIVSAAAYFFIIGRYGLRAGDRVTVGGVTGTVLEVGLVRFYLMELVGASSDVHETGRMIMFPNAILFQNTPLYKQVPGTDYVWHEVAFALATDCDQAFVESRLLEVVVATYNEYRTQLEHQHDNVERLIDLKLEVPRPRSVMHFAPAALELVIRYPILLPKAQETDALLETRLLQTIRGDPKLSKVIQSLPRIQSVI